MRVGSRPHMLAADLPKHSDFGAPRLQQRTFVIGTAGHVDHGKSSLVRALTGTDPDRLAEEQRRQMTIDLGFAELITPAGNHVHIVDVPGHERFVRNMLAGTGGIDAALLVIAADDGPMPQTREHLAILDLLGIQRGVVALSKADLVDDDWLAFVRESIGELLEGTALSDAEIVTVSSQTGLGLPELTDALDRTLLEVHRDVGTRPPRLPIDRVFTMPGFGVVVTGTLLGGGLSVGDRVAILPGGVDCRIRGLQTFGASVEAAKPGSRVAVNLSGIEANALQRGDVLSLPGAIEPAMRFDARMRLISASERPLRQNDEVIVFAGAAELPARVAILDGETVEQDNDGWVQFRMARPISALAGDRFIVRRPSPPETIGGGTIVELDPSRHKRNQTGVIERLERLAAGDPRDQFLTWMGDRIVDFAELDRSPLGREASQATVETLRAEGRILALDGRFIVRAQGFDDIRADLLHRVERFHSEHPLENGIAREQLREALQLAKGPFDAVINTIGR